MNKKKFDKIVQGILKAAVRNELESFFRGLITSKTKTEKLTNEQMEILMFYRFVGDRYRDICEDLINNKSEGAAHAISFMKMGWMGHSEFHFHMFLEPEYREKYLNAIDEALNNKKRR